VAKAEAAAAPLFDDLDADCGLPGVPAVATGKSVQGVWGARVAAAAAGVAAA
jgi:hypothetical protein